jgi:hypothetical protein
MRKPRGFSRIPECFLLEWSESEVVCTDVWQGVLEPRRMCAFSASENLDRLAVSQFY